MIDDEPTSGLDVAIQAGFLDDTAANVRARGSAVLLITQDPGILANHCDEVLVMEDGEIVERAGIAQFFAAPQSAYARAVLSLRREKPPQRLVDPDSGAVASPHGSACRRTCCGRRCRPGRTAWRAPRTRSGAGSA